MPHEQEHLSHWQAPVRYPEGSKWPDCSPAAFEFATSSGTGSLPVSLVSDVPPVPEAQAQATQDLPPARLPIVNPRRYNLALAGRMAAERLDGTDRDRLLAVLLARGWTDIHIATHTLWTTYTVARIRERIGLPPNKQKGAAA